MVPRIIRPSIGNFSTCSWIKKRYYFELGLVPFMGTTFIGEKSLNYTIKGHYGNHTAHMRQIQVLGAQKSSIYYSFARLGSSDEML